MDSNQEQTYCIGGRHYYNTNSIFEYDKRNLKTNQVVEVRKGKGDICGRSKSIIFTR